MHEHIVQAGSTLFSIARALRIPLSDLIAANQITDPSRLQVGQRLIIPSRRPASKPVAIDRKTLAIGPRHYFAQKFPKDLIMLHFTAGSSARSAYDSWRSTPSKVATAYLVDTDGSIYECFPPEYWAYHLGVAGAASADWKHDKRSIGIEIANAGPLRLDANDGQQLNWWPNNFKTKFCTTEETAKYVKAPYRGFAYFASFPPVQCDAVVGLVDQLCSAFSIPRALPPEVKRTAFDIEFFESFRGIASHQNFRRDKLDIGPAFPLHRVAPERG